MINKDNPEFILLDCENKPAVYDLLFGKAADKLKSAKDIALLYLGSPYYAKRVLEEHNNIKKVNIFTTQRQIKQQQKEQTKMKNNSLTITFKTDEGRFYSKKPGLIYDDLAHSTIWDALKAAGIDPKARGWNPNDLTIDVVDQYRKDEDWGECWCVTANVTPYDVSNKSER